MGGHPQAAGPQLQAPRRKLEATGPRTPLGARAQVSGRGPQAQDAQDARAGRRRWRWTRWDARARGAGAGAGRARGRWRRTRWTRARAGRRRGTRWTRARADRRRWTRWTRARAGRRRRTRCTRARALGAGRARAGPLRPRHWLFFPAAAAARPAARPEFAARIISSKLASVP